MASAAEEIPLGGKSLWCFPSSLKRRLTCTQGMNEHAIYDLVGAKRQRFGICSISFTVFSHSVQAFGVRHAQAMVP